MSKVYPPYSATALTSICASIQSVAYAMCTEEWAAWKLGWNIRLLTVVYTVMSVLQIIVNLQGNISKYNKHLLRKANRAYAFASY